MKEKHFSTEKKKKTLFSNFTLSALIPIPDPSISHHLKIKIKIWKKKKRKNFGFTQKKTLKSSSRRNFSRASDLVNYIYKGAEIGESGRVIRLSVWRVTRRRRSRSRRTDRAQRSSSIFGALGSSKPSSHRRSHGDGWAEDALDDSDLYLSPLRRRLWLRLVAWFDMRAPFHVF